MRPRFSVLALAALLAACADRSGSVSDLWAPPPDGKGVATVVEYRIDYDGARRLGLAAMEVSEAALQKETLAILRSRMSVLGFSESRVMPRGSDWLTLSLPAGFDDGWARRTLLPTGDLKFRIEVDPDHMRTDQAPSLWKGTVAEFERFKQDEIAAWKQARDRSLRYEPKKDPAFRVVRRANAKGEGVDDFAVVLEPTGPDDRFGGEIVTDVAPSHDERGMPAISFAVRKEYQGVFGDWTEKHQKQPVGIIVNDEFEQAPVIQERLTDTVQISLGANDVATGKVRQREWLAWLRTGSLRAPLVFVSSSDRPPPR